jgi:hypothetical protein
MLVKRVHYLCLVCLVFASAASAARVDSIEWTRQLGTSADDRSTSVSADGLGNVYISGVTRGSLGGPYAGGQFGDAFVSKYDAAGTLQWSRQLGTSASDESLGVSADGLGNVYISGSTGGSLGRPNAGSNDAFVSKYDAAGTLQWSRQLGTSLYEESRGVSADGLGNVYIAGSTGGPYVGTLDAFVSKYDAAGALQWSRQFGTSTQDESHGVSADGLGNVYVSGFTEGSLAGPNAGGRDAFVSKYDAAGTLQWSRQLGTSGWDAGEGVSADGLGNVYISGYTGGSLGGPSAGDFDAFVSKYDAAGTLTWSRQLGTSASDYSLGASADRLGNVYISGSTLGSLGGPYAGGQIVGGDAFVSKYDAAGTLQWSRQLGTSENEESYGVSADGLENIYFSGYTGGPYTGTFDAFVAKISDPAIPEPSTLLLLCIGSLSMLWRRRPATPRLTSVRTSRHRETLVN